MVWGLDGGSERRGSGSVLVRALSQAYTIGAPRVRGGGGGGGGPLE